MNQLKKLDNLPFSNWHTMLVLALGTSWIFDGYQVSSLSLCSSPIKQSLNIDNHSFDTILSCYLAGCAIGGVIFGILSFYIGRKQIFITTLIIYGLSILLIVIKPLYSTVLISRLLTGISVGGEYTAIFAAIDQFIPVKYRGRTDIIIDGSWHLGGILAALASLGLNTVQKWKYIFCFGFIGILPLIFLRRYIPESPRWLFTKGKHQQAIANINFISEASRQNRYFITVPKQQNGSLQILQQNNNDAFYYIFFRTLRKYPKRVFVSATLLFCQAFFFNSIYYKFPLIIEKLGVNQIDVGKYMIPLSVASFIGPIIIGPYFDKIGRRIMCLVTFGLSGILLFILYFLKNNLIVLEIFIVILFFISSPAASSANLTASQLFPTNSRCIILSLMFMVGMLGGIVGVWIQNFVVSSIIMIIAGLVGYYLGIDAQNKSLQQIQTEQMEIVN